METPLESPPETPLPPHVGFPSTASNAPGPCPACATPGPAPLYTVRGVPTHSCVLLDDARTARAFPTGDVELAHCGGCGFLFNAAFDPARVDYSEGYEETQGCSATFREWQAGVARDLLARTGVRGGTILEIGCGRGDFLELCCALGDCAGIGVDPSSSAGRVDRAAGRGLRFVRESYGPHHPADLVVCRHTLEHLPDPAALLTLLRSQIEDTTPVFCEVPDVERILAEGAFWDIYYEHCSYFDASSLARLFERTGFEVLELERAYGDQYLQVLAVPAPDARATAEPRSTGASSSAFRHLCAERIARWHAFLTRAASRGETIALWGSGSKATGFLTTLDCAAVACVVDINPMKHGRFVAGTGTPIVAPEALRELRPDHVVVMNPVYTHEIRRDLERLQVRASLQPV